LPISRIPLNCGRDFGDDQELDVFALIRDGQHEEAVSLIEVPDPDPAPEEALVEVRASSLNRGELALLAARPDGWRPGQDLAGVVINAAASGEGPRAGARVAGLVEGGAWSQRVAVPTNRLAELGDSVSFEAAATLGIAGTTALRTVRLAGPLLGRKVLILGAGGGVGHLAVQLAAAAGARVTAHLHRPGRGAGLIDAGAERVLSGEQPERAAFNAVLDGVGGTSLKLAISAIAPGGTIVLFGATDQQPAEITLLDFIGHENARIETYFSYAAAGDGSIGSDLGTLTELLAEGRLRHSIATTVDWHDTGLALAALRSGDLAGKAVLTITAGVDDRRRSDGLREVDCDGRAESTLTGSERRQT
jgi:NADPH:quinone reductase